MMTISPVELVLRVARATVGACESPPSSNAGPFVERVLKVTGNKAGDPWCAAYVAHIGTTALGRSGWPVLKSAGCQALYEWAEKRGAIATVPSPGDVFLLWYPSLNRYAHTGFVTTVGGAGQPCGTIEGNTSGGGSREGWLVAERTRSFGPRDRFIQWAGLVTVSA
jgi:hypothetical protein